MRCPFCSGGDSRVVDTREVGAGIRRRRECQVCSQRFTTYEHVAKVNLMVVKRDGRREPLDRQKLIEGIRIACAKRPISVEDIDELVAQVEGRLYALGQSEVPSRVIGELVMARLRELDGVAYVRFASVYRAFADLETLKQEVDDMIGRGSSQP